jgi:DNA replication protein DnaC
MAESDKLRALFEEQFAGRCPRCQGSRWVVEDGVARRCDCFERELAGHRRDFAAIPPSYQRCTIDRFTPQNKNQQDAKLFVEKFIKNFETPEVWGRGILFRGPVGVGKTHLAVAVLQALIERGFTGKFYNFVHLIEEIKKSFEPDAEQVEARLFHHLRQCQVVVLDELGATRPSEFVFVKLYDIINSCFDRKISVLFTTNYGDRLETAPRRQAAAADYDSIAVVTERSAPPPAAAGYILAERVTQRLYSRIMERCTDVILDGPDFRLRHKQAAR